MVRLAEKRCSLCGALESSHYASVQGNPSSRFLFIVPPSKEESPCIRSCIKMFDEVFMETPSICAVVRCKQKADRTIPIKAVRQCNAAWKSLNLAYFKGVYLFGSAVQKSVLGKAPNVMVAGGHPAAREGVLYIAMPEPRAVDDLARAVMSDLVDERSDLLKYFLVCFRRSKKYFDTH